MNNNIEAIVSILLSGRTHRDKDNDYSLLQKISDGFFTACHAEKPYFVFCNTIQSKSCFLTANEMTIVIFDYSSIEIMEYLNSITVETSRILAKPLFHRLYAEYMYTLGYLDQSLHSMDKWINRVSINICKDIQMLTIQQIFIVNHELFHYHYSTAHKELHSEIDKTFADMQGGMIDYIESTAREINTDSNKRLDEMISYYQELGMHQYVLDAIQNEDIPSPGDEFKAMRKYTQNKSYLEESVCDKYASIKAFNWGVAQNVKPEICMSYICSALNSQLQMSFINSFFQGELLEASYNEFNTRIYYVYFIIFNYAKENGIAINENEYENALAHEFDRSMKIFETVVDLSLREMDSGLPSIGMNLSDTERDSLLKQLKTSLLI